MTTDQDIVKRLLNVPENLGRPEWWRQRLLKLVIDIFHLGEVNQLSADALWTSRTEGKKTAHADDCKPVWNIIKIQSTKN